MAHHPRLYPTAVGSYTSRELNAVSGLCGSGGSHYAGGGVAAPGEELVWALVGALVTLPKECPNAPSNGAGWGIRPASIALIMEDNRCGN